MSEVTKSSCIGWLLFFLGCMPALGMAADPEQVGEFKDWTVLTDGKGTSRYCYAMTWPKDESQGRKPYLLVAHQPGQGVLNQVELNAGARFMPGSEVLVKIGNKRYQLFTQGDGAWAESELLDSRLVAQMRRGSTLKVEASIGDGTKVVDRYSLMGFTAAMRKLNELCR